MPLAMETPCKPILLPSGMQDGTRLQAPAPQPQQSPNGLPHISPPSASTRCTSRSTAALSGDRLIWGKITDEQGGRSQLWASISKYTAQPPRKWSIVATGRRRVR